MSTVTSTSTTLLEQSTALRARMAKVSAAEADRQITDVWQPLRENLPVYCEQLERLVVAMRLLHGRGLLSSGGVAPENLSVLKDKLAELRERLLNEPTKVMQKSRWANTELAIKSAAKALEQSLTRAWQDFVTGLAPQLDDWAPFFQDDQFGVEVRQIKRLQEELERLRNSPPVSEDSLRAAELIGAQIHALVKKLDFGDIPKEVKAFLSRVMNPAGATLADLSPEGLEWLTNKGLARSFRLKLGSR